MNVRTSLDNSRVIGYKIDNLGTLKVFSIISKADALKGNLTDENGLNKQIIVENNFKKDDYFSLMTSLVTEEIPPSEINVFYQNPPKSLNKPNSFEIKSRKLTV